MTRKDYELIARAMRHTLDNQPRRHHARRAVLAAVDSLAHALAIDNPRFDRARFIRACTGEEAAQ